MKLDSKPLEIQGEHVVNICRQQLWSFLNDADVLQQCIKGCESVVKLSDDEFEAEFRLRVGSFKKTFKANLAVSHINPPEEYRLESDINAGLAGNLNGIADVELESIHENQTKLIYRATINASGWLGGLGLKVLGSTAKRYMHQFFEEFESVVNNP